MPEVCDGALARAPRGLDWILRGSPDSLGTRGIFIKSTFLGDLLPQTLFNHNWPKGHIDAGRSADAPWTMNNRLAGGDSAPPGGLSPSPATGRPKPTSPPLTPASRLRDRRTRPTVDRHLQSPQQDLPPPRRSVVNGRPMFTHAPPKPCECARCTGKRGGHVPEVGQRVVAEITHLDEQGITSFRPDTGSGTASTTQRTTARVGAVQL